LSVVLEPAAGAVVGPPVATPPDDAYAHERFACGLREDAYIEWLVVRASFRAPSAGV
jgi:hypothetical protein